MDFAAFISEWRKIAAAQGIDAAEGITSYQLANMQADRAKARAKARACEWWAEPERWWDESDDQRPLEREVFRRIFWAAWRVVHGPERGPLSHREAILRPLRDIHAARGQRLEWVNVGKGQVVGVLVDIEDEQE